MVKVKLYKNLRQRRKIRIRSKVKGTAPIPRLSVFRSNRHIFAQIVDDEKEVTLASCEDLALAKEKEGLPKLSEASKGLNVAYQVGFLLAKRASAKNIKKVVFDRGAYRYHGKVKALADGARAGGLVF